MNSMFPGVLFCLAFVVCGSPLEAQSIVEMYLDLPSEMIGRIEHPDENPKRDKQQRMAAIQLEDKKNGYIETKGGVHFAKYSRQNSTPLLVVAGGSYPEDGRERRLQIFEKSATGVWRNVTDAFISEIPMLVINAIAEKKCGEKNPRIEDSAAGTYRYILPRKGRLIRAVLEGEYALASKCKADLYTLAFDGTKFSMSL